MNFCKYCGSDHITYTWQTFKDNSKHQRIECGSCGKFNGYAKQNNGFDKLIIRDFEVENHIHLNDLQDAVTNRLALIKEELKGHKITIILKAR